MADRFDACWNELPSDEWPCDVCPDSAEFFRTAVTHALTFIGTRDTGRVVEAIDGTPVTEQIRTTVFRCAGHAPAALRALRPKHSL